MSRTWELQEVRLVAEGQVVVGDEVEQPDVELLRVVALGDRQASTLHDEFMNSDITRGGN